VPHDLTVENLMDRNFHLRIIIKMERNRIIF